jgi:hypothetical protein
VSGRYRGRLLYYPPEDAVGRVVHCCDDMLVLHLVGDGREIAVRASECLPYLPRVGGLRPRLATVNGIRVNG